MTGPKIKGRRRRGAIKQKGGPGDPLLLLEKSKKNKHKQKTNKKLKRKTPREGQIMKGDQVWNHTIFQNVNGLTDMKLDEIEEYTKKKRLLRQDLILVLILQYFDHKVQLDQVM